MSDLELLFLVIALLYAWECACWIRLGSIAFVTWLGSRWRITHPGTLLGNQRGGFILAPPLPPLGTVLVGHQFPLSLSSRAVLAYVTIAVNPAGRPAQSGTLVHFDEIQNLEAAGKKLRINGRTFFAASSVTFARHLAGLLEMLRKLTPEKRSAAIEEIFFASLDTKTIEKRWDQFCRQSGRVKLLANAVFVYLFMFAPWLIWKTGLLRCWLSLLIGLLALTASTAISFHRVHKSFYPAAEDDRFMHFLITLLSPVTTIRARDVLSRPLMETFHPVAIAKVFCAEPHFRDLARAVLLDLRHPTRSPWPLADPMPQTVEKESRALLLKAMERFLKQHGIDPRDLVRPPAPNDETCHSYCPRCEAQFTGSEGTCADCGGVPLEAFDLASSKEAPKVQNQEIPGAGAATQSS
jgi:hypothetical protein